MTDLEIKLRAWDSLNHYGEGTESVRVYNKACIYGRNDVENRPGGETVAAVGALLASMNHDITDSVNELGWTKFQILDDIEVCTAFHVVTHADYHLITSDFDEFDPGNWEYIYAAQQYGQPGPYILDTRINGVGTGSPPYNNGVPPVNIAFLYACCTGEYNSMANAFLWPYYHYNATDQAEAGWRITVGDIYANRTSTAFWGALADAKTAAQARQLAVNAYFGQRTTNPQNFLAVWGDFYARLYGVYTGSKYLPPEFWYYY